MRGSILIISFGNEQTYLIKEHDSKYNAMNESKSPITSFLIHLMSQ